MLITLGTRIGKAQCIQLFRERLTEKKAPKCTRQDRMDGGLGIHWNFAYCPTGNVQVCIFEREEFVFLLRKPLSEALLLLSHVCELGKFFQNSAWLNVPCFHMSEEIKKMCNVVISH